MEDSDIIGLYFDRDERAISESDAKYGVLLRGISKNLTGSPDGAEECVSDTYLAAWNAIPPTVPQSLRAYLCRIVRNLSVTYFRKSASARRKAVTVPLTEELSEILPDRSESPETGLTESIERFLREEREDNRLLFVRRYFYGDSPEKLAGMTMMSVGQINARLFRLRKRLAKYLKEEGFAP